MLVYILSQNDKKGTAVLWMYASDYLFVGRCDELAVLFNTVWRMAEQSV